MKCAATFALGILTTLSSAPQATDEKALRAALTDYAKTTQELRASSAKLRGNCHGPRLQIAPYVPEISS